MTTTADARDQVKPLTPEEMQELATYRAEYLRGLVHADYWHKYMAGLQARFDAARMAG